jgi:hypothetical protein
MEQNMDHDDINDDERDWAAKDELGNVIWCAERKRQ